MNGQGRKVCCVWTVPFASKLAPTQAVSEIWMNLESKWLEDFIALAATRSFSQAAERRFVTQPAFSRRIRSLESALGLTLVNRSRTPVELTAAGQLFLVTARTVVDQLGEVLRHLHHLEGGQGEVMQVAAAHSLALGFFPRWIAQLRNEGLNIATRLVATNVGEAVHALREGGCDLMLAFYDPDAALQMDPDIFPSLHLAMTEMLPVCAADAEGQPLFNLEGENSVPLLAYSAGAFLGRSVNLLLRQRNLGATTERAGRAGPWRTGGVRRPAMACAAGNSTVSLCIGAQGQCQVVVAQTRKRRRARRRFESGVRACTGSAGQGWSIHVAHVGRNDFPVFIAIAFAVTARVDTRGINIGLAEPAIKQYFGVLVGAIEHMSQFVGRCGIRFQ